MSSATSKATAHGDGAPPARRVPPAPSLGASIAVHARLQVLRLRRSAKLKLAVGATLPMVAAVALSANLGDDAVGALRGGYKFALFLLLGYLLPFLFVYNGALLLRGDTATHALVAALLAVLLRCNLPLSVCLVWLTNPLTMPALFFMAYEVGALIIDAPVADVKFALSFHWLGHTLVNIWQPFLLGCLLCGLFFGCLGYFVISLSWRWRVSVHWKERQRKRAKRL